MIREMTKNTSLGVEIGIGDDAALFHFSSGEVILSIDSFFEGVHFELSTHTPRDIGWKAVAASLSDIAAMGGEPLCAMIALSFPSSPDAEFVRSIFSGAIECLESFNSSLVGGDITEGKTLGLTVSVVGTPTPAGVVRRSGSMKGDVIGVTGTIGDSAAGLKILKSGKDTLRLNYPRLVESHLRPKPKFAEGVILARMGATAMEDISDGLASDMKNICIESGLGCEIDQNSIPLSEEAISFARTIKEDPYRWALVGGEDYELLFTCSFGDFKEVEREFGQIGKRVTCIGRMVEGKERKLITSDGVEELGEGYEHFVNGRKDCT